MMFRVAHISDVHISAPQGVLRALRWHDAFEAKRVLGAINVLWRRGPNVYSPQVLEAAVQDMKTQGVDHLIVSGDLTNMALESEFAESLRLLEPFGPNMTVVPGNHDIYTKSCPKADLIHKYFGRFMSSSDAPPSSRAGAAYPFVHRLASGRIALYGVNSAVPQAPFVSAGLIDSAQLSRLDDMLSEQQATDASVYKVVVLHHPPVRRKHGLEEQREGLWKKEELASVLERHHVDLVLHGHVHRPFVGLIGGPGSAVVIEPGSGTYAPPPSPKSRPLARYNIYTFTSEQQPPPASSVPSSLHQKNSTWSLSNAISRRLVISSVRSGFTFDNDTLVLPR